MPETKATDVTASGEQRATLNQVLWRELQALRPEYCASRTFQPAKFDPEQPDQVGTDPQFQENLRELYQMIGTLDADGDSSKAQPPLAALCLSGGGIRSATFNLGVLQALAKNRMLGQFDYLSSVSGGGYIASWLQAWLHRQQQQEEGTTRNVFEQLGGHTDKPVDPLAPEPRPVDHLREFSNYLTPQLGLFSGDTWTAAATILRNLLLNWLVILPLLGALVVIPQGLYLIVQGTVSPGLGRTLLYASLIVELAAGFSVYYHRRLVRDPSTSPSRYAILCVLPVLAAAGLLSFTGLGYANGPAIVLNAPFWSEANRPLLMFSALWCMGVPLLGWIVVEIIYRLRHDIAPETRHTSKFEFAALVISGLAVALLFAVAVRGLLLPFYRHPGLYVMLALPVLLGLYLLARTLFVGLASLSETFLTGASPALVNDGDREWWARLSGWILAVAIGWIAVTGLCLFGQFLLDEITDGAKPLVAAAGGISGVIAALLGSRDKTASSVDKPSLMQRVGLALAAPVFVVCVALVISWATSTLGGWVVTNANVAAEKIFMNPMLRQQGLLYTDFQWFWALPGILLLAAVLMGLIVNVNRFSLHGFYRNRLVRAYLGASHIKRKPDPFTGFDAADNLRMHKLRPASGGQRLLPLINVTLNLLREGKLAWQERKAESFSITPYFCGNFHEGYRASATYGGQGGISLGTAVTISGAAANPHMGYCSSPALAFVMSLFNVRLGAWLGNTNSQGDGAYHLPGPRQALSPMLGELFGLTTPDFRYVNLSDGGHFDNLGLYEVVLRRCRYIFVSDAGCDPDSKLGDLGNAIRKIRIDFGIPIRFEKEIEIYPNSHSKQGLYCATACIDYDAVDKGTPAGRLVYIKPTLRGRGEHPVPYDVYSYARTVDAFPHESTADQWFSESQFESYRMLGLHALEQILRSTPPQDFADFFARAASYMNPGRKRREFKPGREPSAPPRVVLDDQ